MDLLGVNLSGGRFIRESIYRDEFIKESIYQWISLSGSQLIRESMYRGVDLSG